MKSKIKETLAKVTKEIITKIKREMTREKEAVITKMIITHVITNMKEIIIGLSLNPEIQEIQERTEMSEMINVKILNYQLILSIMNQINKII